MRLAVGVLALTGFFLGAIPAVHAQSEEPDPCTLYAARMALPSLQQSYAFSPAGYGPFGYAPLMYPFGAGPYGVAAFFGPPGLVPAFGPLGPGLTANWIAQRLLAPAGVNLADPANVSTLLALATLQQAELGTLNTRYSNAAYFQTAAATWAGAYATQAATAFTIFQALCQNASALGSLPGRGASSPSPAPSSRD